MPAQHAGKARHQGAIENSHNGHWTFFG